MVWTDPVWHYFPPWMLWQNRGMWSRRNSVCSESSPKAFDMSSGITKLPITSWSVDNIYNRVLCCKSISINYNMHGWFLCWYHATGWVWWKSGLRAVAMWSSSSFTKRQRWCWLWCGAEQATCHSIQTNEGAFIKSLDHDNLSTDPDDTQVRWLWSMHSTVKIFPKSAAVGRCAWQSSLWNRLSMQMIWCRVGCKKHWHP